MAVDRSFWRGKRVLITGHTGFKGGWLALWLTQLGADVVGYALPPVGAVHLFGALRLQEVLRHEEGDIRDQARLLAVMQSHRPDVVFHLAAQALVRPSYDDPVETYDVNVMGSLKVLECVRRCPSVRAVVMVTTDKCYDNKEWCWAYREIDPMGGHDPYSSSKGAMELMVASYRRSYFSANVAGKPAPAVATVRAGNVIGGGDWSEDRLVPDLVRAFSANAPAVIRNRHAVRPWQHVLQPLRGYLQLAQQLVSSGHDHAEAWNFGPQEDDCQPVGALVQQMTALWGDGRTWVDQTDPDAPHEAHFLKLDSAKARDRLGWRSSCDLPEALRLTVSWYRAHSLGQDMRAISLDQIAQQAHEDGDAVP